MSSNLACIGMGVTSPAELSELVAQVARLGSEPVADSPGVQTYAWQDASGARVVLDVLAGKPLILPSFASTSDFTSTAVEAHSPDVARVTVLGEDGVTETGVTCELEQRRHVEGQVDAGRIRLVALGINVTAFDDEPTFLADDASLLGTEDELGPPPPEVAERGLAWPPRMSASAFFANGFYPGPVDPTPHALLSGVVLRAEVRTNSLTGRRFVASRVLTAFGELDLCLPEEFALLLPGQVIAGTVAVVGRLLEDTPAASAERAGEDAGGDDDAQPRPGETRREWRDRTGR